MAANTHSDRTNYIAWVLWLIGFSEGSIAQVLGKRRKQVAGIITRSPYKNRSAMTDADRQAKLNELLMIRTEDDGTTIDGGVLDNIPLKIIPLRRAQKKGA